MKIAKREKYLDAIYKLILDNGISNLLMEDIAKQVGVTKMTLYNNFSTKNELIKAIISYRSKKFLEYISSQQNHTENAIDELMNVLKFQQQNPLPELPTFYKSFLQKNPRAFSLYLARFRRILKIFIVNNIKKGVEQGIYRQGIDADSIAQFSINTMDSMINRWLKSDITLDLNTTHEHIIIYHIRGIASPKGHEYLEIVLKND